LPFRPYPAPKYKIVLNENLENTKRKGAVIKIISRGKIIRIPFINQIIKAKMVKNSSFW
jgi:hypothetical protein